MRVRSIAALAFLSAASAVAPGCSPGVMPAPAGSVTVTPQQATVGLRGTVAFTAVVTGEATPNCTWSVQEPGGGTVDASGKYTAPANPGTFHVVAASVSDPTKHDAATVAVTTNPVITVSVSPKTAATTTGGALTFSAVVAGTTAGQSTSVTWSVQEAGGGTVDGSGRYAAPGVAGTFHVIATSVADPTKTDTATVSVTSIAVAISPRTAATTTGGALTFTAAVTGTLAGQSTAVTWSVKEPGGGTVDVSGHYTAPGTAGTFHVIATSVADPTKTDTATVSVASIVVISAVSPVNAFACEAVQLSATVTGTSDTLVLWSVPTACGTITAAGVFTPARMTGACLVTAQAHADLSKQATITVNVALERVLSVAVVPASATVASSGALAFAANVTTACGTFPAGQ
jgi:hypothetical protein